ncbi:hypothetical protein DM02DRAFT_666469 [Periconia macrospinosa]|uniref:Uncharacterized protein n=1 Tax=Periconia macrospinosa TaxID=97972 RepID=A0A2V1EE12_9PLEO|nr:hypothetical protein DM02DRAFT_666469 [Periconia macrospinosa]
MGCRPSKPNPYYSNYHAAPQTKRQRKQAKHQRPQFYVGVGDAHHTMGMSHGWSGGHYGGGDGGGGFGGGGDGGGGGGGGC